MKSKLLIFIFLTTTFSVKADYVSTELYVMILKAEKIVYGEVVSIDSATFDLRIEKSFTGESGILRVSKFADWPCARRWTTYQLGQRLFLFLTHYDGRLIAMSGGNEGELPIYKGSVYINASSLPPPIEKLKESDKTFEFFDSKRHLIYNHKYYGYEVDLDQFEKTVKSIRACFRTEPNNLWRIENAEITCSPDHVQDLVFTDKIFRWTYKKLQEKTGGHHN